MPPRDPDPIIEPLVELGLKDGSLVKEQSAPQVYVILADAKFWIPSVDEFLASGFDWASVQVVPDGALAEVPDVPREGTLVRERTGLDLFLVRQRRKRLIPTPELFTALGFEQAAVRIVPRGALAQIPTGGPLAELRLDSVLEPGVPPCPVLKNSRGEWAVLPAAAVIVRFRTPGLREIRVDLDGRELPRAASLADGDALSQRQQAYFTSEITSVETWVAWQIGVVRAPRRRRTPISFTITVRYKAEALTIPVAARTKPSDVFFDGGDNSKPAGAVIARDIELAGWLANTIANGNEDFHYWLVLDVDFVEQRYGGGSDPALTGAILPGNPPNPSNRLPFQDISETGESRGVTLNSFTLPGNRLDRGTPLPRVTIWTELNMWHTARRGAAPRGWVQKDYGAGPDAWWPYDPSTGNNSRADSTPDEFSVGDYVLLRGTLFEDFWHGMPDLEAWDRGKTRGHAGWIELHPVDWIVKAEPPPQTARKTTALVQLCTPRESLSGSIVPDFEPSPGKVLVVRDVRELIDGRFTDLSTVVRHDVRNSGTRVDVNVAVRSDNGKQGRFKAVYIVSWEEQPLPTLRQLSISVQPVTIRLGRLTTVTVFAEDAATGTSIGSAGSVRVDDVEVGTTAVVFSHTFRRRIERQLDPDGRWTTEFISPTGTVVADGYEEASIPFVFT